MNNPFAELELDPKADFEATVLCRGCKKTDTLMGYKPGEFIHTKIDPHPTMYCTCKTETPLIRRQVST